MTIHHTPAAYSSLNYDLIYTVSDSAKFSDPATYPGYKFIGDIYVGAVLVARLKRIPDPITGMGIFNIAQIVRNYITTAFNPTPGILVPQQLGDNEFRITVTMKFGEEYSFTPTYDILSDSPRVFFNHYNNRLLGTDTDLAAKANEVASDRPLSQNVFLTSGFIFVPYFPSTTSAVNYIVTPTGGGTAYATTFTPGNALDMQILNVSPVAINSTNAGTINAATTSYTVTIGEDVYTFKIVCESIHTPYTLHWLNKYGGFESFIFQKASRKFNDPIQRKDYGRLPYTVDGAGVVSYKNSNGVYNEHTSTYSVQYKERLDLNSDLINDEQYTWLAGLILSPMVYMEEAGYFYPVKIPSTTYEFKKYVNDDLQNLLLSIEFGNQQNAQYR